MTHLRRFDIRLRRFEIRLRLFDLRKRIPTTLLLGLVEPILDLIMREAN